MQAIIFNTQLEAEAFASQINSALGYPRKNQPYNGGTHASCICPPDSINLECPNITLEYSSITKHPTLDLWAYEVDDVIINLGINGYTIVNVDDQFQPITP